MKNWLSNLKYDPSVPLLSSQNKPIEYFTKRDIINEKVKPIKYIWNLPEVEKILKKQQKNGSWKITKKYNPNIGVKYELLETWRNCRFLIEQYEFTNKHTSIQNAADFIFSCQTDEGDIRGILANQYTPYYTGAIISLLNKAGYTDDPRIEKGLKWLLKMRQNDGGWVIGSPGLVGLIHLPKKEIYALTSQKNYETVKVFDRTKPFSAAGTGMVIRAFATHPNYKKTDYAVKAGNLLKSKLFKKDNWSSYQHPDNWIRFQYPFWWTNILSALDSLTQIGFTLKDSDIKKAAEWLIENQQKNGLWKVSYSKIHKATENKKTYESQLWITLTACKILKKLYNI
jgi:prenyltransferase beta subunit